jgi:hypothetical protein
MENAIRPRLLVSPDEGSLPPRSKHKAPGRKARRRRSQVPGRRGIAAWIGHDLIRVSSRWIRKGSNAIFPTPSKLHSACTPSIHRGSERFPRFVTASVDFDQALPVWSGHSCPLPLTFCALLTMGRPESPQALSSRGGRSPPDEGSLRRQQSAASYSRFNPLVTFLLSPPIPPFSAFRRPLPFGIIDLARNRVVDHGPTTRIRPQSTSYKGLTSQNTRNKGVRSDCRELFV